MNLMDAIRKKEQFGTNCGDKALSVAYGVDKNFVFPMGVSMTSVLRFNPSTDFYVFVDEMSQEDRNRIKQTVEKYNTICTIYYVDKGFFTDLRTTKSWSVATYFRFLIGSILYGKIKQILYLDADVMCCASLTEMINEKWDDYSVAAVSDPINYDPELSAEKKRRLSALDMDGYTYFNAGVMYINLEDWHKNAISETALKLLRGEPDKFSCLDQDVLNALLKGRVCLLDKRYNVFASLKYDMTDAILLHFSGAKPWWTWYGYDGDVDWKYYGLYQEIKAHSAWSEEPYISPSNARDCRMLYKKRIMEGKYGSAIKWYVEYLYRKAFE